MLTCGAALKSGHSWHALAQLDQMTQQSAAMLEQSSAAASWGDQAQRLVAAVKVFFV